MHGILEVLRNLILVSAALSFIVLLVVPRRRWLAFWIVSLLPSVVMALLWTWTMAWSAGELALWAFFSAIAFAASAIGAGLAAGAARLYRAIRS